MKRLIISAAVMLLLAGGVQAQTTEKEVAKREATTAHKAKAKKTSAKKANKASKAKGVKVTSDALNERRIYKANNGQRATPTGHEAASTSGGYAALKKDTAVVVPKEGVKTKKENEEQ